MLQKLRGDCLSGCPPPGSGTLREGGVRGGEWASPAQTLGSCPLCLGNLGWGGTGTEARQPSQQLAEPWGDGHRLLALAAPRGVGVSPLPGQVMSLFTTLSATRCTPTNPYVLKLLGTGFCPSQRFLPDASLYPKLRACVYFLGLCF